MPTFDLPIGIDILPLSGDIVVESVLTQIITFVRYPGMFLSWTLSRLVSSSTIETRQCPSSMPLFSIVAVDCVSLAVVITVSVLARRCAHCRDE